MKVYFQGEWLERESILKEDYEIKEILTILEKIGDEDELDLKELGSSIFYLASSPSCMHGMGSIQIQALANIGTVLMERDEVPISRSHLYEKVFLAFFKPKVKNHN